jgi:prepilin-type N-terminal cleavage/methylation domain-containing protein
MAATQHTKRKAMNTLHNRIRAAKEKEGGFTLIELLVVIVILGVLAAVVVFSVRGITDRGQESACQATRSAIITGAESAFAQTGAYPATLAAMETAGFINAGGGTIAGSTFTGSGFALTYAAGPPPTVTNPC